jgi:hypothetical protein
MNCASAREVLWPPERPHLAHAAVVDARRHVESCRACQEYLRWDEALLALHGRSAVEPPPALRERVFDRLAAWRAGARAAQDAHSTRTARLKRHSAAVFAVAVAVIAGLLVLPRHGREQPTIFVDDYLRRAVSEDRITTSDPEVVARFLTRELGRPARPLDVAGLSVLSAEICLLGGVRGAMIQYERNGQVISHYLMPRASTRTSEPAARPANGGPAVVTWLASAFEQALIADLPPDSLLALTQGIGASR